MGQRLEKGPPQSTVDRASLFVLTTPTACKVSCVTCGSTNPERKKAHPSDKEPEQWQVSQTPHTRSSFTSDETPPTKGHLLAVLPSSHWHDTHHLRGQTRLCCPFWLDFPPETCHYCCFLGDHRVLYYILPCPQVGSAVQLAAMAPSN